MAARWDMRVTPVAPAAGARAGRDRSRLGCRNPIGFCAPRAQVETCVEHLAAMHMTLELLQETAVGRVVKRVSKRREPALAAAATRAGCASPPSGAGSLCLRGLF